METGWVDCEGNSFSFSTTLLLTTPLLTCYTTLLLTCYTTLLLTTLLLSTLCSTTLFFFFQLVPVVGGIIELADDVGIIVLADDIGIIVLDDDIGIKRLVHREIRL